MSAQDDEPLSLIQPYGAQSSTCGYCSPSGVRSVARSSHTFGLEGMQLSCSVYQKMVDRGWRRSGTYCYKPNLATSCCPQYTIRLDVKEFSPSRSQRKVVYRFNRFVLGDGGPEGDATEANHVGSGGLALGVASKHKGNSKKPSSGTPGKPIKDAVFSLIEEWHSSEAKFLPPELRPSHKYEVTLEPASFTQEKFELYCQYQANVHNEPNKRPHGFKDFLCDSPLIRQPIPYTQSAPAHLPKDYGSYHQLYRLDGELMILGVIDILPHCVSSVYLIYSAKMEEHSPGKLSALKEIALAQEMARYGAPGMGYLYMGFYIHSCQKMRYKGQYAPSYLLEPEEYSWFPFDTCATLLDAHHYVPFAHPSRAKRPVSDTAVVQEEEHIQQPLAESGLSETALASLMIGKIKQGTVHIDPAQRTAHWRKPSQRKLITNAANLLGEEVIRQAIFVM